MYIGIHCVVHNGAYDFIEATIPGPKDTPYENIEFKLSMEFGRQYPFRPPTIKFITPVYHPNIDTGKKTKLNYLLIIRSTLLFIVKLIFFFVVFLYNWIDGKICLDVLQMPPGGSYNPAITLESILLSIQLLLGSPNVDDPLRNDVSDEYRYNRVLFNEQAAKLSGSKTTLSKEIQLNDKEMNDKFKTDSKIETKADGESSSIPKASRKRKHDDS